MANEFEGMAKALQIPANVLNKLDKVDEKINKIATDSENMAKAFQSAMQRMGDGSGALLQRLTEIQGVLKALGGTNISGINNIASGMKNAATEAEKTASAVSKAAEAMNKYRTSSSRANNTTNEDASRRAYIERYEMYKRMFDQIERNEQREIRASQRVAQQIERDLKRQEAARARLDSRMRRSNYQDYVTSTEGSLRTAGRATNYNQRAQAINNLEAAMKRLNTADANYEKDLKRLSNAHKRLTEEQNKFMKNIGRVEQQQSSLMNHTQQLSRQLALLFSVSAIEGYVTKLIQVRGEFEKQNVALTTLLGNKDQADKLQGQITELAVQSPFSLRELTTYAKSLAAYQVQYEELYDTTKMLADVASGLGVDMQRLILAFGQVKAANFLRGTETRQFTEAGINMLGELAKYYSELEGRIVSVGEVQERQFRRMISFQDVEEVFKRLTSAGGMFYNMQENQAKTLAGLWTNLTDSIDVMFNEIGTANDSTLKNFVILIRDIIENWREVAWYLEKVAVAFGVYKAAVLLAQLGSSNFVKSAINMDRVIGRLNIKIPILSKSLLFLGRAVSGIIAGGALLLVTWLIDLWRQSTKASREAELLANNLKTLVSTDSSNLDKTIKALDDLIARFKLSNEGSQERRDIISSLNNNYGEYLDFMVDEKTSLEDLTSAYDEVIKRMKERASLSTLEKGYQQINNAYEEALTGARESFENELGKGLRVKGTAGFNRQLIPTEEEINDIYNILQQKIRETDTELIDSSNEQRNLFQQIIQDYYGKDVYISQDYLKTIPLIDAFIQKKEQEEKLEKNINSQYKETLKSREANLALSKMENDYEKQKRDIQNEQLSSYETQKKLREASQKFELDKIDIQLQYGEISEESAKRAKERIINWATSTTEDINKALTEGLSAKGFSEEDIAKVLISPEEQSAGISAVIKNTTSSWETQNQIIAQQIQLKNEGNRVDDKLLDNAVKLEQLYRARAEVLGIELDYEEKINKATLKSINQQMPENYRLDLVDAQKSVNALQEEYNNKYNEAVKMQETLNNQKKMGVVIDETALALADEQVLNYDKLRKLLGWAEEENKGGSRSSKDPMLDRFKEIIKLIEEAKKRYDELNEEFGSEVATQMVRTQFSDTPAGDIIATMTFDAQGVVNGLNKAIQSTGKAAQEEYRKVFQDASRPFETKLLLEPQIEKREELEQQIEDMFDQYNLSIELTSTGVSGDAIKSLFDTDIIDLVTLKSEILKLKPVFEEAGLNWQEVWEKTEERLTEESNKQLQERLKSYAKYLKQTVSERARIEIEAQKKIADIQNIDTLSDTQKQGAISNIREEADKEKAKVIWEDFQNTDLYISMFEDLENVSTKTLEYMRQKLIEIRDTTKGLPVEDIKAINEQLDKMQEVTISRNPFQGIADNIREVVKARKEWNEVEDEYLARNEEKDFLEKSIANQEVLLSQARARYDAEVKTNGAFSVQAMSQKMTINLQEQSLSKDRERLKVIEEILKKLGLIKDNLQWSEMSLGQRFSQIGQWAGELSSAIPEIASSFENIFGNMGDKGSDIVSTVSEVLGGVGNMAAGVGRFMSGDVIGGSIQALTGLVGTIGSLVQIGDKKKERQIQRELELVENLEKAYEKLEEAIDNAYSIDTLGKATEGAASNIKDQIDSYEEMIRLEQDKKKTDKDRIKEWEEQIEQLEEQLDEIYTENFNKVTGDILSDVLSAAENFTDAWLNAFLETGDGMQGLEDSFDDMITNMLKRQASMLITQQWIEQWKKQLEQYINPEKGDLELTTAEAKKWVSSVTSSLPQLNEALEAYFKAMEEAGVDLSGSNNGDNMSGLQRGIQSITEQTAEVLAALLESVRFFVSDENAVIHNIYNWLTTMPAETPLMQELRLQTQHLASMDSLLTSVIKSSSGKGKVMRVEIV